MNLNGNYLQLILALQCTHMLLQVTEEPDRIEVSQCPSEIEVVEGTSINMECFYEEERHVEHIRVDWSKDSKWTVNATSSNWTVNPVYDNRLSCTIKKTKAKLTIKNIAQEDAGLYLCKIYIEIPPPVRRGSGNGTKLTVRAKNKANNRPELGALLLLVILVAAILYYKKRQKSQRNAMMPADAVREEIHEENHENEGSEENSSSRGSSQWVDSSLYQSFDYFAIKGGNKGTSCNASNS
ncbi:cytotoxic T-lymphocyte protein 4-like isoform X2 [Carcharodon carcharias]|uniref:cytotoxic T-lymphocyte protein 4-like isoform X2 n=1 Tax=Carcharodon carcharias TaxID=13397 RepID=UPI001B7E2D7F|nr:cytotoxic T-lymphocyte protein 4-like isoform X2 [Carcharodon carcharias]